MHVQSCLAPVLIRNPRDNEQMYVPCGKCAACLRARSSRWVQRLDSERYSWKYSVFFTLTYAPQHLPYLTKVGDCFLDLNAYCTPSNNPVICINIDDNINKYAYDKNKEYEWLSRQNGKIACLSSYHLQKFLKRLRTYSQRFYEKSESKIISNDSSPFFRYFAIGEYGSTTIRPHYHGILYFNSEWLSAHIGELFSKCWSFGITDFSFVNESNSSYVAQYLNCLSHLPTIYRDSQIRPFFLCSKFPPIGTIAHKSAQIWKIFFEASNELTIFQHNKGLFANVSLWRCYRDRLFPRLTQFDKLSHFDRVTLYGLTKRWKVENFMQFLTYCVSPNFASKRNSLIIDYVDYLKSTCENFDCALQRWFYISRRVCVQSESLGISISDYVSQIEKFFINVDYQKLKLMYEFEVETSEKHPERLKELVGLDPLYLQALLDCDIQSVSLSEINYLQSFGIDIEKFFSEDMEIRVNYQRQFLPSETWDFHVFKMDSENWYQKASKTRRKNEYLALHPELQQFVY